MLKLLERLRCFPYSDWLIGSSRNMSRFGGKREKVVCWECSQLAVIQATGHTRHEIIFDVDLRTRCNKCASWVYIPQCCVLTLSDGRPSTSKHQCMLQMGIRPKNCNAYQITTACHKLALELEKPADLLQAATQ